VIEQLVEVAEHSGRIDGVAKISEANENRFEQQKHCFHWWFESLAVLFVVDENLAIQ
jgi:hypothetical protein